MTTFLLAAAVISHLLVLRSGDRIPLLAPPAVSGDHITFRTTAGLFTIPLMEVDLEATNAPPANADGKTARPATTGRMPLKVSEAERKRLLAELEQNHSGVAAPAPAVTPPAPEPRAASNVDEEWSWRNRARAMDEAVQQVTENRDLLLEQADELRGHISTLLSLGFKPSQFTWDSSQLDQLLAQIPHAELEITRAERARDQFRDEARRRGVLPGWLR